MGDMRSKEVEGKQGKSLVLRDPYPHARGRDAYLVVTAPRPVPLRLKPVRRFSRVASFLALCGFFAGFGYCARDPWIRGAADYRLTLLTSVGVSSIDQSTPGIDESRRPLAEQVLHLFADGRKGPRADRVVYAAMGEENATPEAGVARRAKSAVLTSLYAQQPAAALAGATLFLTALTPRQEAQKAPPPDSDLAPARNSEWTGLLKNASLSPEEPKALFGGFTEDEFRQRELRCMAIAIYFEARDEPVRGQIAVGQVVMNRIRSPYYPKTICGVVYQGERLRRGCQFSFTCNGRRNSVSEKTEWLTSVKVAKQVISREVWLDDVGFATHYHATYVHPDWRRELDRVTQIGGHIFYKMKPGTIQVALLNEGM